MTVIAWSEVGMFSAVGKLYGLRISLRDLRLSNVAGVLATYEALPDLQAGSQHRWPDGTGDIPN